MSVLRKASRSSVSICGAGAGCIVRGAGMNNRGLRLQILQGQARGNFGGIRGAFVILDVGDSVHSRSLGPLLHRVTGAAEVLATIRQEHPGCFSVVNTNILIPEES
jgi:hypothetical protein